MILEEAPLRRQGKERSTVTAAKMSDNKATDSTEKDIGRIFKDMSYATVQEGCGVAEVRHYYMLVYINFHLTLRSSTCLGPSVSDLSKHATVKCFLIPSVVL